MLAFTKKLRERKATEDTVEGYLVRQAKKRGGLAIKIRMLTGWPDRLILLPGGWLAWAECKRPKGGKFEPLQQRVHQRLIDLGFRMFVPHTKEEVDEIFTAHDQAVPTRTTRTSVAERIQKRV